MENTAPTIHPAAPSVTLVIIDTESYELGLRAVNQSVSKYPFQEVLIFSDDTSKWGNYSVNVIPKMTQIHEFNQFIIKELPKYLETDFFLVIQFDGFILNASEFRPEFFNFDYIGAPWYFFKTHNVGNGGFSLRSRRLAEAVAEFRYDPHRWPEDAFICRKNEWRLRSFYNCRIADEKLASHFSVENQIRPFPTFGFHGLILLPMAYKDDASFLIEHLPKRILKDAARFKALEDGFNRFAPDHLEELRRARSYAMLQAAYSN